MNSVLSSFQFVFENNYFVLVMYVIAFIGKAIVLSTLALRHYFKRLKSHPSFFLLVTLLSAAVIDVGWICILTNRVGIPLVASQWIVFLNRFAWAFFVVQYHAMVFLLITLITRDYKVGLDRDRLCLFISSLFILFFTIFPMIAWNLFEKGQRPWYEFMMKNACSLYLLLFLMPRGVWRSMQYKKSTPLPVIIRRQYKTLLSFLVLPYYIADFVNMNPLRADYFSFVIRSQAFTGISTLILTCLLYFCMRRMLNIRFLNHDLPRTPRARHEQFDEQHRLLCAALDYVRYEQDIVPLVQPFVARLLSVEPERVALYIRPELLEEMSVRTAHEISPLMHSTEMQLDMYGASFRQYLSEQRYLFYDDAQFLNFYEWKAERVQAVELMATTGATVWVPLLVSVELIGYIVVKKGSDDERLYDAIDRDRLIACAAHIARVVAYLREKEKHALQEKHKALTAALVHADQQLTHLKETMQTFFHPAQSKQIALFYYKNRQFFPAHLDAEKLLGFDFNTDVGHETVQACMQLIEQVREFRSRQSAMVTSIDGKRFLATAFIETEQKQIFLLITSCDLTDLVSAHLNQLSSMNEWTHLLSLQTTKLGEKLNAFLPGRTKGLVQLKVALFQKIERKQSLFFVCDSDDFSLIAHFVHDILGRAHNVAFIDPLVQQECAIILFGKKWPYGMSQGDEPLLKTLDGGTLCIKNCHALPVDVQEQLIRYMQEGQFKKVGGTAVYSSDVHLLCMAPYTLSSDMHLSDCFRTWAEQEQIIIPSPTIMQEADLRALIEGYSMQALRADNKVPLFTLSEHDIQKIVAHHPVSLTELKMRVLNALKAKHKEKDVMQDISFIFDPAFLLVDQTLATAARLGKNALKQKQIMKVLWFKFDKNQNRIAQFLGVERSSVHRRVKQYKFT